MERALRCPRFQPSGVPQKCRLSCACVLCLPHSGSQELDRRTLPVCGAPSPLHVPSPSPRPYRRVRAPCVSPRPSRPSRRMSTIQNLRKSLVRNWRPVCSAVGDAVLGAEPAPCPCLLPPAGLGRRSLRALPGLAKTLCSVNSRQCVRAG